MATKPTPWPPTVPVLTGRDIYRGNFTSPDGCRRCLLGWANEVFTDEVPNATAIAAIDVAKPPTWLARSISAFNDDPSNLTSQIAAVWNRAMRELGYTERV